MKTDKWHAKAATVELAVTNLIDGKAESLLASPERADHNKYSPRDGTHLYSFNNTSEKEVEKAVASAKLAFEDGRWRKKTLSQRAAVFNRLVGLIEEHKECFSMYECLDVGKPITRALNDDINRAKNRLWGAANLAPQLLAPSATDGGCFAYRRYKPVGVVVGIVGWNYPLSMALGKIAPALIMGNSLVLKPSEFSGLSTSLLGLLALEAGVPAGVLNIVHGDGQTVGANLAAHTDVDLLAFVGSSSAGKRIMTAAGQSNMKRLLLECGGKSPFIVFDDGLDEWEFLAQDIVDTAFGNQGAVCVAGSRLLIQESLQKTLLPLVVEKAKEINVGDPLDPNTTFGALINEEHLNKVLGYIDSGQQQGAKLLCGGKRVYPVGGNELSACLRNGYYLEPTILADVDPQSRLAQEEIFGPVLSVLTFRDEDEAIQLANNTRFGLSAYAATSNLARAQRLGEKINAGSLLILGSCDLSGGQVTLGADKHGESGFGFSGGLDGLAAFSQSTVVYVMS